MFVIIHFKWRVRFRILRGCIKNRSVEVFYKEVWGNSITNVRKNVWRYFFGYGVMLEDFLNGEWPGRYRVENVSFKKIFKVFSFGYPFLFC